MRNKRTGFTLLELIVAIALGSLVFLACSTLMVSVTEQWMKEEKVDNIEDHIQGIVHFLEKRLQESFSVSFNVQPLPNQKNQPNQTNTPQQRTSPKIAWIERIGGSYLRFKIQLPHNLIYGDFKNDKLNTGIAETDLILEHDKQLYLCFSDANFDSYVYDANKNMTYSTKNVNDYGFTLSPWFKSIQYIYFDKKEHKWSEPGAPKKDTQGHEMIPDAIELTFEKDAKEYKDYVFLEQHAGWVYEK